VATPDELRADVGGSPSSAPPPTDLREQTDVFERQQIQVALTRHAGSKTRAARDLGITYRGLLKKMQRLGMV
jgi:transcriptional regulator with GAF, ATPase, and Fis domain